MWINPLPAFGLAVPVCIACFQQKPFAAYWKLERGHKCEECHPFPPPNAGEMTPLREDLKRLPLPSAEDITAYHLEVPLVPPTPEQVAWQANYKKVIEQQRLEAAANRRGCHVGQVGDRLYLGVLVDRIIKLPDNEFGERYLCVMTDLESNGKLKWFTGANLRLKQGQSYTAKMTVKEHTSWQGEAETIVNRVQEDRAD